VRYPAYRNLYKKFLYFRHFINLEIPLIVCEGKTDTIYLRSALKALCPSYPQLGELKKGNLIAKVHFLKHSRAEHDILELSGGAGNLANLIAHYRGAVFNYKYRPLKAPVIVLVDNGSGQSGGGGVFVQAKKLTGGALDFKTNSDFYYLCHNLHLIKTPELGSTGESCMEDLFDASVRAQKVGGKNFNPKAEKDTATEYGKFVFADKVVRANYDKINFSQFTIIFDRISAAMVHYNANKPSSATP
jgi:RNA-directed DNA polymerase